VKHEQKPPIRYYVILNPYILHLMKLYSLGCDVAKDEHVGRLLSYDILSQQWQQIGHKTVKNTRSGANALKDWLLRRVDDPQAQIRLTMEATGIYYEQLALLIHEESPQIHLSVVMASQAKAYQKSRGLRNKTDKIDAEGLARMGAERKLTRWRGIDPFWRKLRELTRSRARLESQKTQVRNRLHAHNRSAVVIEEVQASLQTVLETLQTQSDALMKKITAHLESREDIPAKIKLLKTIPGIGLKTIAVVLAETLGFEYFTSISQLMCFSGYDVVTNDSGKRVGKRNISKQGSAHIRKAMYMPAGTVINHKPAQLYDYYQRLLDRHGIKMKAHVALQKKLLRYMFTLWNKHQGWDPAIIQQQRRNHEQPEPAGDQEQEKSNRKDMAPKVVVEKEIAPPKGEATEDTRLGKSHPVPSWKIEKIVDF